MRKKHVKKKGVYQSPSEYKSYHGKVEVYTTSPEKVIKQDSIGKFQNEGMGRVVWDEVIENQQPPSPLMEVKIRKGLPTNLTPHQKKIVTAMLLHDFVGNDVHPSKIQYNIEIEDHVVKYLVKNHHSNEDLKDIQTIKKYDCLAASITRTIRFKSHNKFNLRFNGEINWAKIKEQIEERQHSPYTLYSYIYSSKELGVINEDTKFGFTTLRLHLLMVVNLYLDG
jgi:hypothetical protein